MVVENKKAYIFFDEQQPMIKFAAGKIKEILAKKGYSVSYKSLADIKNFRNKSSDRIILSTKKNKWLIDDYRIEIPNNFEAQRYVIRNQSHSERQDYFIIGGQAQGAMYGGLDFSERVLINNLTDLKAIDNSPYIKNRGIKLNIPLDARTPSYSDCGDSAQENIKVMWDLDYWKRYLNKLAENKYNTISLWNLHPFPSMVKVDDYPDVALDDVMQADINWERFNSEFDLTGKNMVTKEVTSNLKVIKRISIAEKIKFWQQVMKYAKNRGIKFYIITWNIFTWGAYGKYDIDNSPDNPITKDYIRKSVKELFDTYPHLAGIGVTAGENMGDLSPEKKEKWLFETYGRGVLDAIKEDQKREIRFIHRHWWSDLDNILNTFQPLINKENITFDFSFKYSRAHMYSDTNPVFADSIFETLPEDKKMWCNLRNDDIYMLRWGDPDYVREYILNIPHAKTPGFYIGSDGYVFGRECVSKNPDQPAQMELDKNWYNYLLWGKLAFDPREQNVFFKNKIKNKFNLDENSAEAIYSAWKSASEIIPLVTKFHWHDWDFQWHVESCTGREGFYTVEDFIENPTMEGTDLINIADYCELKLKNEKISSAATAPPAAADKLGKKAEYALEILDTLPNNQGQNELTKTIEDIRAMAYLGFYYSHKIKGAINLCFHQKNDSQQKKYYKKSIAHLKKALSNWKNYARIMSSNYRSPLLARIGRIDWVKLNKKVESDIEIVSDQQKE